MPLVRPVAPAEGDRAAGQMPVEAAGVGQIVRPAPEGLIARLVRPIVQQLVEGLLALLRPDRYQRPAEIVAVLDRLEPVCLAKRERGIRRVRNALKPNGRYLEVGHNKRCIGGTFRHGMVRGDDAGAGVRCRQQQQR